LGALAKGGSMTFDRSSAALAGRCRLDRELGHGGMATVYLAHDPRNNRPVAVNAKGDHH
jgi:hypothetical protein